MSSSSTSNLFLTGLSPEKRNNLISQCAPVELPAKKILYGPGEETRYVYFLNSGMASVGTPMADGAVADIGSIGREGLTGGLHLLGDTPLSTHCEMKLAGAGLRISYPQFQKIFATSVEVRRRVMEVVQEQTATAGQIAGCNQMHNVEHRLLRWLLMAQDLTQSDPLNITHEDMAMMMGSHRSTITVIAQQLQYGDLIRYSRGVIHFLDRPGLEALACDCYPILKKMYSCLYSQVAHSVAPAPRLDAPVPVEGGDRFII